MTIARLSGRLALLCATAGIAICGAMRDPETQIDGRAWDNAAPVQSQPEPTQTQSQPGFYSFPLAADPSPDRGLVRRLGRPMQSQRREMDRPYMDSPTADRVEGLTEALRRINDRVSR